ncbi:MAG: ribonuclease P protein component [Crocinitomicaceae bacterium]|nr:ribonuclease P protein component [Crocinitomicaceae bacterium]|tara:strand:+ start:40065 stop:40460 length:396 start_codon:yes stop_codon:yes gene_type:complete
MAHCKHTYGKDQRLKSVLIFDQVFTRGEKIKAFPILARHTTSTFDANVPFQVATTVSKRRFRKAVSRNRIKRLMREAWRLEKHRLETDWTKGDPQGALILIYVGHEIPTFENCADTIRKIVDVLLEKKENQ